MRKKIVGASWKMHVNTIKEGVSLAEGINNEVGNIEDLDIFILPSFPLIHGISEILKSGNIDWGAQNICFEKKGAYTGEVPAEMLKELGCKYIELAHAERKKYFNETDYRVNQKIKICEEFDFIPVICIGETEDDLNSGKEKEALRTQILDMLDGVQNDFKKKIILAYEPVWAIGKSETAGLDYISKMHSFIRDIVKENCGEDVSKHIRIIYGGSVNPETSDELLALDNVDGVFIGRFGLNSVNFKKITDSALKNK
jgi:triosephosphate isomerase